MCDETFRPYSGQDHIHIIVTNLGIQKYSDLIQLIDDPAMIENQGHQIPKCGEVSDSGIGFHKVNLLITFNS